MKQLIILAYFLDLLSRIIANNTSLRWVSPSSPVLNSSNGRSAIGVYNGSIFILGQGTQLTEYQFETNTIIDYQEAFLSNNIGGSGQYYTQINNSIYIIRALYQSNAWLSVFNMKSKIFESEYAIIPINTRQDDPNGMYACLASSNNFIFTVGGDWDGVNTVQVFDLTLMTWLSNIPGLQQRRRSSSCIFHPFTNKLYAISGSYHNSVSYVYLNTIETINITNNLPNEQWEYNNDNLLYPVYSARSIIYKNYIWVIGGENSETGFVSNVQIIDVMTGQITLGQNLNYTIKDTAAIIVNEIVYAFGGNSGTLGGYTDKWQYIDLRTPNPTNSPTHNPTLIPTITSNEVTESFDTNNLSTNNRMNTNTIIGISVGGVVFVIIIIMCIYGFIKQRESEKHKNIKVTTMSKLSNHNESKNEDVNFVNDDITVNDFVDILKTYDSKKLKKDEEDIVDDKKKDDAPIFTHDLHDMEAEVENDMSISVENVENNDDDIVNTVDRFGTVGCDKEGETDMNIDEMSENNNIAAAQETDKEKYVEVRAWLESINLNEYQNLFIDNGYEFMDDILQIVTDDDLKEIGIEKPGHRKRILKSIKDK